MRRMGGPKPPWRVPGSPPQLTGEVRELIPAEPGRTERYDYEYRRNGTALGDLARLKPRGSVAEPRFLFGVLPYDLCCSATRRGRNGVLELISGDRELSLLLDAFPVRVHGMLDLENDRAISIIDAIATPMRVTALHGLLVFVRGALDTASGSELGPAYPTYLQRISAARIEDQQALRGRPESRGAAAVRLHSVGRNEGPTPYEVFSRLSDRGAAHCNHH